jgi:hypothetical protein
MDANACAQIQDSVYNSVSTVELTSFDPAWTDDNVSGNVQEIIDSLKANDIVVEKNEVATWVSVVGSLDTNYVCLISNINSVTLFSDRILRLKLMDVEGNFRSVSSVSMPLETVGGCLAESGDPLIKTRIEYATPDEDYLFYIINEETTFPADEEEFIIILSIQ